MANLTENLQGLDDLPDDALSLVLDLRRIDAGVIVDGVAGDLFVKRVDAMDGSLFDWLYRLHKHGRQIIDLMYRQPNAGTPPADPNDAGRLAVRATFTELARRGEWLHIDPAGPR